MIVAHTVSEIDRSLQALSLSKVDGRTRMYVLTFYEKSRTVSTVRPHITREGAVKKVGRARTLETHLTTPNGRRICATTVVVCY